MPKGMSASNWGPPAFCEGKAMGPLVADSGGGGNRWTLGGENGMGGWVP